MRKERTLRWLARGLGSLFVLVFLTFLIGEALMPAPDETSVTLRWYDYAGLAMMGVGIIGFVIAWWWPTVGGILGLLGLVLPIAQTLVTLPQGGALQVWYMVISPFNLAIAAGILHVIDGRMRRRGIGPPNGKLRAAQGA